VHQAQHSDSRDSKIKIYEAYSLLHAIESADPVSRRFVAHTVA